MVSADDNEPQVDPHAPEGAAEEGAATAPVESPTPEPTADAAPPADAPTPEPTPDVASVESPAEAAPAVELPTPEPTADAVAPVTPASTAAPEAALPTGSTEPGTPHGEQAAEGEQASDETDRAAQGEQQASDQTDRAAQGEQQAPDEATQTTGDGNAKSDGATDGEGAPKRRRRSRGRRHGRGGQRGGRRRFQWDEIFLRQRLETLRAMDPDPTAIAWAVATAGRFDVADILAGEGSSGREFGRRAYGATPETDDQAAWIILSAVRARDIVPIARQAVSGVEDQREQVRAAIERVGIARVNPALQGERPAQQVFAERARRVDLERDDAEQTRAAWALLSLARPQDVRFASAPKRPRPGGPGGPGRPGGGRFGSDDRRGRRREPGIPGGVFSVGESGIGGELGAKLRAALEAAESGETADTRDQEN